MRGDGEEAFERLVDGQAGDVHRLAAAIVGTVDAGDVTQGVSSSPPPPVVDSARDRVAASAHRANSWPVRFAAAAAIASIVVGAIAMSGAAPDLLSRPSGPTPVTLWTATAPAATAPAATAPAATAPPACLAKGVVAEVVRPFSLVPDRGVLVGQRVYVVVGPVAHEGKPSYLVQHYGDLNYGLNPNSDFGWIGVDDALASLRPVAVDCPTGSPTLGAIAALQPFERLVCAGGRQIELGPVTTREFQVGASSPTWLSSDGSVDFPTAIPYVTSSSMLSLDQNRWYTVEGHFDDPGCERDADPVRGARCRQQFVLTSAITTDPPAIFLDGTWRRIAESPLAGRTGAASAWTGKEALIWGGEGFDGSTSRYIPDGAGYDPVADRWRHLPPAPIGGRVGAFGVWTGSAFLVWGGYERRGGSDVPALDGALFDPVMDRWESMPAAPLDDGEEATIASWTDTQLVVFSGRMRSGAAFDISTGRWRRISRAPFDPGDSNSPALAWTGTELVVLGYPVDDVDTSTAWATAWNAETDNWRPLPEPGVRSMEGGPAVWTGREVVVSNRAFDPATERWRPINNACGAGAGGVWTGRYAIQYGRAFDTLTETCRNMPPEPERPGGGYREFGVDVWTGTELIRWSGGNGGDGAPRMNDGVAFDPRDDLR